MRKEPFLYLISFLLDASFGAAALCIPLLAMRLGGTYDDLGAIGAVAAFLYCVGAIVLGRLSDRIGYRRSLIAAALASSLCVYSYPASTRVVHLICLVGVARFALSGFWPPMQAWLGSGKDRRELLRTLGGFNICWSLGVMVGPLIGGRLYAIDESWPFTLAAAAAGLVFVLLLLVRVKETAGSSRGYETAPVASARRFLRVAWVANFATFFATGAVRSLFPKLASDLGILPTPLGQLMALIGVAQLGTFFIVSRTERWQFRLAPLVATQCLGIAGLLALAAGSSPQVFMLSMLAQGVLAGVTFTSSLFYSLYAGGPGGRRAGPHEAILGSGFLFGPILGGLAAEHMGPRAPYVLSAAVILLAIAVEVWFLRRAGSPERHPAPSQSAACPL